jgi:hypothetical protein
MYLFGRFNIEAKLVAANSAGTISCFYVILFICLILSDLFQTDQLTPLPHNNLADLPSRHPSMMLSTLTMFGSASPPSRSHRQPRRGGRRTRTLPSVTVTVAASPWMVPVGGARTSDLPTGYQIHRYQVASFFFLWWSGN